LLGGVISGNTADWGGGLNNWNSYFIMSGGEITNNIATNTFSGGGGVAFDGISLDMTGGVIAGNRAPNGGGMYTNSGKVQLSGGVISDNTASDDGGGIYAKSLEMLYVLDGIVFANNQASTAYERLSYDDVLYHEHIGDNVVWTLPFSQGYNNYDISYISETPMPSTQANPNSRIPTYAIAFIALIICILAVVLNFYFKNKKDKQTATKLNQIQHIIYLEERHQVRIVKQIS
jgi:predicted outer membrane repeat protein